MNRSQLSKVARAALAATDAVVEVPAACLGDARFAGEFTRRGCFFGAIDSAPVFDKLSLMHALYQTCAMPAHFGFNWDALADSLSDWSWLPATGHVLALRDPRPLRERAPADLRVFEDVVRAAAARQAERGRMLRLLLGVQ